MKGASKSAYACLLCLLLTACATTPPEPLPSAPMQTSFKEAPPGWIAAAPADALDRGQWWALFNDDQLNTLAERVQVSNQNIAAAVAAYDQARALVREQRAALFPAVDLSGSASRTGGSAATSRYQLGLGASWEPDLWGRLRGTVNVAGARAQASAAEVASARLSATGELATSYFNLRETDAESALLRTTIEAYQRSLQITRNRYEAGVAPHTDVLQAQTQLANAEADLAGLERQRAQLEHAIAVLVGEPPGNFTLSPAPWNADALPAIPVGVPSTLLQRRPDIAAAERTVAAASGQIGVTRTAFYPSLSLSGTAGFGAARVADLFTHSAWSLGLSLAQVVFDAGATRARVDEARAAWEQAVAHYRQTVLSAFRDVEDQLAATRVLERQYSLRREASQGADLTEQQVFNRYRAGQVSYTEVVTAQVSALSARRSLVQLGATRQAAAVVLIQALGGGWQGPAQ